MLEKHVHETPENMVNQPESSCCRTSIDYEKISKFELVLFTFSQSFELRRGWSVTLYGVTWLRHMLHVIGTPIGSHHQKLPYLDNKA